MRNLPRTFLCPENKSGWAGVGARSCAWACAAALVPTTEPLASIRPSDQLDEPSLINSMAPALLAIRPEALKKLITLFFIPAILVSRITMALWLAFRALANLD